MRSKESALFILISLTLLAIAQAILNYQELPEVVASHFDASGDADGWMARDAFVILDIAIVLINAAVFFGIQAMLPRISTAYINVPNREYWLAAERKSESLNRLSMHVLWFGNATVLFLVVLFHQIYQLNIENQSTLDGDFWKGLLLYFALIGILIFRMYRDFRRPEH